jgi:hypothetical protein
MFLQLSTLIFFFFLLARCLPCCRTKPRTNCDQKNDDEADRKIDSTPEVSSATATEDSRRPNTVEVAG